MTIQNLLIKSFPENLPSFQLSSQRRLLDIRVLFELIEKFFDPCRDGNAKFDRGGCCVNLPA